MDLVRGPSLHVTPEQARTLPNDPGHPSAQVLAHGSMEVRWYRPRQGESHLPHDRDELYCVVSGTATFNISNEYGAFDEDKLGLLGEQHVRVAQGDLLFVPAGAEHGFDQISPDFAVWAIFYGPEGGESP